MKLLVSNGSYLNIKTSDEQATALIYACYSGHLEIVRHLLELNGRRLDSLVDTTMKNKNGLSALHRACIKGHTQIVKLLVVYGANVNEKTLVHETPFLIASREGHILIIKWFLQLNDKQHRVDINTRNEEGWNALHMACFYGHTEIVKLLLSAGMIIHDTTNAGERSIDLAVQSGHADLLEYLF